MAKSKFDEFMNMYDKETGGKYTYYYRNLWDACQYADEVYTNEHKKTLWETKSMQNEWLRSFLKAMKEKGLAEELQKNVELYLTNWLETI